MLVNSQPCVTFTSNHAQPCIAEESAQPYTHGYDLVSEQEAIQRLLDYWLGGDEEY